MERISDMNLLATASTDSTVLMWDIGTVRPKRALRGHKKEVHSVVYDHPYHCVFTAGLENHALVWNPYAEKEPIFRQELTGHDRALCGLEVVRDTPQVITADIGGVMKLWDVRNFRCVQTFGGSSPATAGTHGRVGASVGGALQEFNTICYMSKYSRLAAGTSNGQVLFYNYKTNVAEKADATDTLGVTSVEYCSELGNLMTVSGRHIRFWSAATGRPLRTVKDISTSEVTASAVSPNQKRIYIGNAKGQPHPTVAPEFGNGKWLVSAGWDGVVRVHHIRISTQSAMSDSPVPPRVTPTTMAEFRQHCQGSGVTCLAMSPPIDGNHKEVLLASGGEDGLCIIYDFVALKRAGRLSQFKHPLVALSWAHPTSAAPLLVVADRAGVISLWSMSAPISSRWSCLYAWNSTNPTAMHSVAASLTAMLSISIRGQQLVVIGDANGGLHVHDLHAPPIKASDDARGPSSDAAECARPLCSDIFELTSVPQQRRVSTGEGACQSPPPLPLIARRKAHDDAITQIAILPLSDDDEVLDVDSEVAIVTVSLDRKVRIWSLPTLEALGFLCLNYSLSAPTYRVPLDPTLKWRKRVREGIYLLTRADTGDGSDGEATERRRDPTAPAVLSPSSTRGLQPYAQAKGS
ncbi:hypothetical protein FOZ61_002554 [Perkinsus olseni]|uniref:Guanine nucleotide-binding protein subunit beta-like protein n=1 Tax=Perkinsus olseni TaxID=32597 RepID=A0A7J6LSS3_PEROL|nr:hypothetical protein FOZ61_002554 [Perkinsus olseni]